MLGFRNIVFRPPLFMDGLLIFVLGEDRWCCGWAAESGPAVVEDAPPPGDLSLGIMSPDYAARLHAVFAALEATPSESVVLIGEPPGTSSAAREALAAALFASGVPRLWIVASPLLALFNTDRDTLTLVEVDGTRACILPVYAGHPVVDGVTEVPLAHGPLFSHLHEALLAATDLADLSLRSELLASVVVVGHGSSERTFASRLRADIDSLALARDPRWRKRHWVRGSAGIAARGTLASQPWAVRVVANPDRTIGAWLGAQSVATMDSAQARFVDRATWRAEPSVLHERCLGLGCHSLDEQRAAQRVRAAAEFEADYHERRRTRAMASRAAEEARQWWVTHPTANGEARAETERERLRTLHAQLKSAVEWHAWRRAVGVAYPPPRGLLTSAASKRLGQPGRLQARELARDGAGTTDAAMAAIDTAVAATDATVAATDAAVAAASSVRNNDGAADGASAHARVGAALPQPSSSLTLSPTASAAGSLVGTVEGTLDTLGHAVDHVRHSLAAAPARAVASMCRSEPGGAFDTPLLLRMLQRYDLLPIEWSWEIEAQQLRTRARPQARPVVGVRA